MKDEDVKVKISQCQNCNGIVRAAVVHMMTKKSIKDFMKEVVQYDLNVTTIQLIEYRKGLINWCTCKSTTP